MPTYTEKNSYTLHNKSEASIFLKKLSSLASLTNLEQDTDDIKTRKKWKNYQKRRKEANKLTVRALRQRTKKSNLKASDPLATPYEDPRQEKARIFVKKIRDTHAEEMRALIFTTADIGNNNRALKEKIRRRLKILELEFNQVFITPWEVQYWLLQYHDRNNTFTTRHIPLNVYTRLKQIESDIKNKNKVPLYFNSFDQINFIKDTTPTIN